MDAIELLVTQHRTLESLFEQVLNVSGNMAKKESLAQAGDLLSVHLASEEQLFYPAVHASKTEDVLLESLEEHLSLKRLLADLLVLDTEDKTFEAKLKVIKEQAEHHHEEEEEKLFPKSKKLLTPEERETLGDRMISLQTKLEAQGNPRDNVEAETDVAAPLV